MSRLDKLEPESLAPDQRELYDSIARGPRARGRQAFSLTDADGRLEGPFNAMLLSPRLGGALQEVGAAVRYASALSDRSREIAILLVAHHWGSEFEVYAHEAVGAAVGLGSDELADLRAGRLDGLAADERPVAEAVVALASRGDLDDAEYAAALAALGEATLFELTTLVGYYATLALQLRVFRVGVPE
ncbi:carboxymuconolactone decarboxylase family protein [uncultured Jatrophihabitans sp.]|uniref:carboxymuconolactone decarboxylase family protein n=1 Tax=uncultured Jatrophihabitans sp. TaxID=1610747 RepID=UPI0035CC8031